MAYSSTIAFNTTTGVLSGTMSFAAPVTIPPAPSCTVADLVITAYADGAQANGAGSYFGQVRTDGGGNWSVSTNALAAGQHTLAVTVDYGAVVVSTTVTTSGGVLGGAGVVRSDLQVNGNPRA